VSDVSIMSKTVTVDSDQLYNSSNLDYDVMFIIAPEERPYDGEEEAKVSEVGMELYEAMDVFSNNPNYTSYDVNKLFEEKIMDSNEVNPIDLPYPVKIDVKYVPGIYGHKVRAALSEEDIEEGGEYYEAAQDLVGIVRGIEVATKGKLKYIGVEPGDEDIGPMVQAQIEGEKRADDITACGVYPNIYLGWQDWIGTPDEIAKAVNGDEEAISIVNKKARNFKYYCE